MPFGDVFVTRLGFAHAHGIINLGLRPPVVEAAPNATAKNGFESEPVLEGETNGPRAF